VLLALFQWGGALHCILYRRGGATTTTTTSDVAAPSPPPAAKEAVAAAAATAAAPTVGAETTTTTTTTPHRARVGGWVFGGGVAVLFLRGALAKWNGGVPHVVLRLRDGQRQALLPVPQRVPIRAHHHGDSSPRRRRPPHPRCDAHGGALRESQCRHECYDTITVFDKREFCYGHFASPRAPTRA
jgi:hypothetical protein